MALYGAPEAGSAFNYSRDFGRADAVVFIVEWTTDVQNGDQLDMLRLCNSVPRGRRIVIDCDGKYNDAIDVIGDVNHARCRIEPAVGGRSATACRTRFPADLPPAAAERASVLLPRLQPGLGACRSNCAAKAYGMVLRRQQLVPLARRCARLLEAHRTDSRSGRPHRPRWSRVGRAGAVGRPDAGRRRLLYAIRRT